MRGDQILTTFPRNGKGMCRCVGGLGEISWRHVLPPRVQISRGQVFSHDPRTHPISCQSINIKEEQKKNMTVAISQGRGSPLLSTFYPRFILYIWIRGGSKVDTSGCPCPLRNRLCHASAPEERQQVNPRDLLALRLAVPREGWG